MSTNTLSASPLLLKIEKPRRSLKPALTQLAAFGKIEQLEALLEEGAEVDSRSPNGSSALSIAAKYGQRQAVDILLKHGAKTHLEAIIAASHAGQHEIAALLESAAKSEN